MMADPLLRGHGRSDAPLSDGYAIESLAADVAAVVDSLGLTRFVLVGHSMGAPVATAYADAQPQRVAGLLLVAPPARVPPEQSQKIMSELESNYEKTYQAFWAQLLKDAQPQVKARVTEGMQAMPRARSLSIIRDVFNYDSVPALRRYAGPKMAIVAQHGNTPQDPTPRYTTSQPWVISQ